MYRPIDRLPATHFCGGLVSYPTCVATVTVCLLQPQDIFQTGVPAASDFFALSVMHMC